MKKQLLLFVLMLLPVLASAQKTLSCVTLKSGVILEGFIKSIDPTTGVKMEIGGVETTINMSDIAKIGAKDDGKNEKIEATQTIEPTQKILVQDHADYPESYELKIGNQTMKMILVRGGEMNMGYDGDGSRSYKSEPVHKVKVTSFYISADVITNAVVKELLPDKRIRKKDIFYLKTDYEDFAIVLEALSKRVNFPIHICTEAEWEYAVCSDRNEEIFASYTGLEICSDFFAKFEKYDQVDPTGPVTGDKRVCRSFGSLKSIFRRWKETAYDPTGARLVVKAKDVIR